MFSIVTLYNSKAEVDNSIHHLTEAGFPANRISVIEQDLDREKKPRGYVTIRDMAWDGMLSGGMVGGTLGAVLGIGFGNYSDIRLLGTILVGGLIGVLMGALGGTLLGIFVGWSMAGQHILKYEAPAKSCKFLLVVNCSESDMDLARHILDSSSSALNVYVTEETTL